MDTNSKRGSMTKAVTICLIAVGLVAGSSLMYSAIVGVYARQPFVGGAIVIGTSENQKVSCSTASSKITHGLQFSAIQGMEFYRAIGTLHLRSPVQKIKADTYMMEAVPEKLMN